MRIWKQLLLCLVATVGGLCLFVYLSADARAVAARWGVPESVLALAGPGEKPEPAKGTAASATAPTGPTGQKRGAGNATLVATSPVGTGVVNDHLSAIGNGEAEQSVVVMPQASGTITEILVSSGDRLSRGQVIARLDDEEQVIARNQAQVSVKSAEEKSALYRTIKSSVSRMDVFDAEIALEASKLQLSTAELNLRRRAITAPIDGVAGIVAVNVGDNVTSQTSIVTIDDRSEILVNFWAPERFASAVQVGMPVEATSIARPGRLFRGQVQAVDNRIDEASRTIRIRARIPNEDDQLRAGMSFGVTMRFAGETHPSVSPLAVQWDGEGSYVWRVLDGRSDKVRVRIVQRNPDSVLVDAALKDGDAVVTEGLQRVKTGGAVRIADASAKAEIASQ